jgi:putative ABC transport system substrate-binding protein
MTGQQWPGAAVKPPPEQRRARLITRRSLVQAAALGALSSSALPSSALAQAPRRVAIMAAFGEADQEGAARLAAFHQQMRSLGWLEGQTIQYETRWHSGALALARQQARELLALKPDVMLVNGTIGMTAIRELAPSVPITFVVVADPVGSGFIDSLARPGGTMSGFSSFEPELGPKWLELIRTVAPSTRHVGVLSDPTVTGFARIQRAIAEAAPRFGLTSEDIPASTAAEMKERLARLLAQPGTGLIVLPASINSVERALIRRIVQDHRAPAVYPFSFHAREGGLVAYGFDGVDLFRRSAGYVSRMLNGEAPASLPVQAPTKFELVVNLRTAREMGFEVPLLLLAQADEVVE